MDIKEEKEILSFYNQSVDEERLSRGIGVLEFERSKDIIKRYLNDKNEVIYDIGGGTGIYSRWLSSMNKEVHMFELAPKAVEYAKSLQEKEDAVKIHSIEVSDARNIDREDESADIVLLMGPLYHLTEEKDRIKALKEASRLLKKNGIIIISTISRYGSALWGLSTYGKSNNIIDEDDFMQMIELEITKGQHIRPDKYPYFIARSFFHSVGDIKKEVSESGLNLEKILSIEGPSWIVPKFKEKWNNKDSRNRLLNLAKICEEDENIVAMSPHIMSIARKNI